MDSGFYIAVFHLRRPRLIRVGRLGQFHFPPGTYLYVGSARRNLPARIARHARADKTLRWHVDYLSTRAEMIGAILIPADWRGPRSPAAPPDDAGMECRIARALATACPRFIAGFGASDCRCGGHLFIVK